MVLSFAPFEKCGRAESGKSGVENEAIYREQIYLV